VIWDTVVSRKKKKWTLVIKTPKDLFQVFTKKERAAQQEMFWLVTVDGQHVVTGKFLISVGCLTGTIVHQREILYHCIEVQAAGFFVAHNHPSGSLTPSKEDIDVVRTLEKAGKLLGIDFIDSLILTKDNYVSFKEKCLSE